MSAGLRMIGAREKWINPDGTPTSSFFRLVNNLVNAVVPNDVTVITVGASPFVFTSNPFDGTVEVIVQGGTVSKVEFGRDGTYYNTGVTQGMFSIHGGDSLRVTYSVAPAMTYVT